MAKLSVLFCFLFVFSSLSVSGQATLTIDGYVYESGNRGFLNVVKVKVLDDNEAVIATGFTDLTGHFEIDVPVQDSYTVRTSKDAFVELDTPLSATGKTSGDKVFVKIEMKRAPGYTFEITLAEKREEDIIPVDAIKGARIEVYNNTARKEHLVLVDHPDPHFKTSLIKGNHYTILVRKEGYLSKRMEAYVDVKGCILCFEGIGSVTPGVADNLSEGNAMGVLLANVELDRIYEGKTMPISNILYEYTKADIKKKDQDGLLDLATLMRDNPDLTVEIGSHTDSRGKEENNMDLSQRRAKNVVEFLTNHGVNRERLVSRGYGESKLLNDCTSFVECSEDKHRVNRRTELKILGIASVKTPIKPLGQIKRMEQAIAEMEGLEFGGGQVKVADDKTIEDVKNDVKNTVEKEIPTASVNKMESKVPVNKVTETIEAAKETVNSTIEEVTKSNVESKVIEVAQEKIVEPIVPNTITETVTQATTIVKDATINSTNTINTADKKVSESIKSQMIPQMPKTSQADKPATIDAEMKKVATPATKDLPTRTTPNTKVEAPVPAESITATSTQTASDAATVTKTDQIAVSTEAIIYRIAIQETTAPLNKDAELYRRHSNLKEFISDNKVTYTISKFTSLKEATNFFEGAVQLAYPEARIVKIEDDKIVEL